ncbi:hypothetical protein [Lysinibacillus piscis]|uniref:Uncharacterized protein n=1 Tax=Lysinibacillus piscis TaxID=2518931 RepID=A0ABQ5NIG9_9BACI|nr:hypothetical protein [Lysinibacillus sp. KH24]GLC88079.1 hypothetical protein LYSBPC_12060 [Lysinibacillus sp. KH24]
MSHVNRHLAHTLEQQHKRSVKGLFLKIETLNMNCTALRERLEPHIDFTLYEHAIDYVNQYISYTTILNLKFITNTQNLEIAVLHVLLLSHILENEAPHEFDYERSVLQGYIQEVLALNHHTESLFNNHQEKMMLYIAEKRQSL